jgi:hypothetical protein
MPRDRAFLFGDDCGLEPSLIRENLSHRTSRTEESIWLGCELLLESFDDRRLPELERRSLTLLKRIAPHCLCFCHHLILNMYIPSVPECLDCLSLDSPLNVRLQVSAAV